MVSHPRLEAAQNGDVHYEHEKPCARCGDTTRYVISNQCVRCTKERASKREMSIREIAKKARGER